ncbi:MAG: hypothetical protein JNJ71_04200 [Rubrivivax sp.]|nr:hypothetical protein [Rubrivivax sp.]
MPAGSDSFYRPYGRLPWRRRLLIALLAIVTAVTVVLTLLSPPGGVQRPRALGAPAADVAPCAPGQTQDCVGSKSTVQLIPGQAAAAAAPAASGSASSPLR